MPKSTHWPQNEYSSQIALSPSSNKPRVEWPRDSSIRRLAENQPAQKKPRANHSKSPAGLPQKQPRTDPEIAFHGAAQAVVSLAPGVNAAFVLLPLLQAWLGAASP